MAGVDVTAAPTLPVSAVTAVSSGTDSVTWPDGTVEGVTHALVRLRAPAGVTGTPAFTVPAGRDADGMPMGLRLLGAPSGRSCCRGWGTPANGARAQVLYSPPSRPARPAPGEPSAALYGGAMSRRPSVRPGGRSARVQEAVHRAVREIEAESGRDALTVPLVASRAGVTPSTVYRRWGDLHELLSDVAVERLRPDEPPEDRGDLAADLTVWAEAFLVEMQSPPGRRYIRDALLGDPEGGNAGQCAAYAADQVALILGRAAERGESAPAVETVLDRVAAPLMYRILFRPDGLDEPYARRLVAELLDGAPASAA